MVTASKLKGYFDILSALKKSIYLTFKQTKTVQEDQKRLFKSFCDKFKAALDSKDPLVEEIQVVENTSLEDAELIRNLDYLYRITKEALDELETTGKSLWLAA